MDDASGRWARRVSAAILGVGGVAALIVSGLALRGGLGAEGEDDGDSLVIPDRYVELLAEEPAAPEAPPKEANPDLGEGTRAIQSGISGLVGSGGGGTAQGLGGMGSGASGYGKGGGTFGASVGGRLSQDVRPLRPNAAVRSERDFLSTFAIDVDTGAYSQARRSLRAGALPEPDAVRTEEFVNAQTYGYPSPDGATPFSVSLEGAPNPFARGHQILRVGLQGRRPSEDRRPVHLTFLVDTSCSMTPPDRLPLAKQAMNDAIDHLRPGDTVAIATYAGSTDIVLGATAAVDRATIRSAIARLANGGGTAMADGMALAYQLAWAAYAEGDENRVVVLSDGDANIGAASPEQILAALAGHARKGVTLSTVGFGTGNYRDAMMEQLADHGDGNYSYIDSEREAERVFGENLLSTVQTIARDVKIQVEFDPHAVLTYRLLGYENRDVADQDFRDDQVDGGEIGAGHTVTALYDVVLADHPSGNLATVRLRYKAPGVGDSSKEIAVSLPAFAVQPTFAAASGDLRLAFGTAAFAEKLRGDESMVEVGWDEILRVVQGAPHPGDRDDELAELIGLSARLSTGAVARD